MIRMAARTRNVVCAAAVLLIAAVVVIVVSTRADSTDKPPYRDAAAVGSIGLCDRSAHRITSGSTTAKPFAWRAASSAAAPDQYAAAGRTATLYAFQPRAGVPADEWSGRMLTAASQYTVAAHPMAAATDADVALSDFLAGYPPQDAGFVQLRLYLGAPGVPTLTSQYAALDLKITGSTWHAVGSKPVSCTAGSSVSFETLVRSSTHS